MKLKTPLYLFVLFGALAACRQDAPSEEPVETQVALVEPETVQGFTGMFKNFTFNGSIPDEIGYVSKVHQEQDRVTGALKLTIGKEYSLQIKEYHVNIKELRQELVENSVFEHVFFDEGDDSFFYEVVMPDGHSAGHHFVKLFDLGARRLLVRTDEQIEYGYFTAHLAAKTINAMQFRAQSNAK